MVSPKRKMDITANKKIPYNGSSSTSFPKPFHRIRKTFDDSFKTQGVDLMHNRSNRKSKLKIQQSQQQQPLLQIEEALKGVCVPSDTVNAKLIHD